MICFSHGYVSWLVPLLFSSSLTYTVKLAVKLSWDQHGLSHASKLVLAGV